MKKNSSKGNSKQDLVAARAAVREAQKAVTAANKEFRHNVAVLKRKGLLDKTYDARSVSPTKYLKSQIKKFGDVLTGKAQPVKVSKAKQKQYKEQGFTVKSGRVVVPVAPNEKVYGSHGDFRVKTTGEFGSITRIDMGFSKANVMNWRDELRKRKIKLKEGERIYFQFYGNNSYQTFMDFEQLIFYFEQYTTVYDVERTGSAEAEMNMIENLVIYKIDRDSTKPPRARDSEERIKARREKNAEIRQRWLDRMTEPEQERYKQKRAEAAKEQRAKQKTKLSPEQIETQKQKARQRAAKSYADRTGKNGKKGNSNT